MSGDTSEVSTTSGVNRARLSRRWMVRYAANAILLPALDMLSNLRVEHAPAIISHVLAGRPRGSGMWEHWRGRYGLSTAQQLALWDKVNPARKDTSPVGEDESGEDDVVGEKERVLLRFRTFDGQMREVMAEVGKTLLDVGKAEGLPSLEGMCGGNLGQSFSW